jgi:mycofactocin precursor
MEKKPVATTEKTTVKTGQEEPQILEEIVVEELSIDGICGVY